MPALHRGERAGQGVRRRARRRAGVRGPRAADGPRGPVPVVLGRRADGPSALLRDGRVRLRARRRSSRSRPTATTSTPENCARLKELGVKAVQVSLDGASRATFNRMRVRGDFDTARRRACGTCAPRACRSRSTSRRRASTSTRSAPPSTSPASSAPTASTPGARCTPATPSRPGATSAPSRRAVRRVLRDAAREGRGVPRPHARLLPRDGPARGAALPPAASGGAADRAAQRPRQAHQRAAVRVRRPAAADAARRSGPTSSAPGRTRASRSSSRISPPDPRQDARRCTNGSISEPSPPHQHAGAALAAGAACSLVVQPGALPLLPLRRAAALPAGRGVGLRDRRARSTRRCSGAASAASCSRSSASRRSTSTSTRGWGPTACSIPADAAADVATRCSGSASPPSRARSRSASTSRCAAAGRSSPSRCWAARRRSSTWRRRSAGPTAGWARLVIALSYGPWMVLGSLYLHTRALSWGAFWRVAGAGIA